MRRDEKRRAVLELAGRLFDAGGAALNEEDLVALASRVAGEMGFKVGERWRVMGPAIDWLRGRRGP